MMPYILHAAWNDISIEAMSTPSSEWICLWSHLKTMTMSRTARSTAVVSSGMLEVDSAAKRVAVRW